MENVAHTFIRKGPGAQEILNMSTAEIIMMQISRHASSAPRDVLNVLLEKLAAHMEVDHFVEDQQANEKFLAAVHNDLVCLDLLEEAGLFHYAIH